jgi:AraC family transcriptional regulator
MIKYRLINRPACEIIGRKTWISGPDNEQFGRFWDQCRAEGLFAVLEKVSNWQPGPQTGGITLGVSRVEQDPSKRDFYYMISVEKPPEAQLPDLETYQVPASMWAVFECRGRLPDAIVESEMYAFMEWLPSSEYVHAHAPEMEVYFAGPDGTSEECYTEFWLPVALKR